MAYGLPREAAACRKLRNRKLKVASGRLAAQAHDILGGLLVVHPPLPGGESDQAALVERYANLPVLRIGVVSADRGIRKK